MMLSQRFVNLDRAEESYTERQVVYPNTIREHRTGQQIGYLKSKGAPEPAKMKNGIKKVTATSTGCNLNSDLN